MLRALTIRNLAIIDAIELEFGDGFSVLSGETGAGKSILIEALGLVLGDRADAALVRTGESQAEVSAEFTLDASLAARAWLREHAMEDSGAANACLLRRVVGADGRSRAFINGAAASLANLRELGELLVEIHGQNEHQRLTRGETQRELLDDFGHQPEVLSAVAQAARDFAESEAELARLAAAAGRDPAQIDYLKHQLRELESLRLADGELGTLDADHRRLANAGRLLEEGQQVQDQLYGAEGSVQDQLGAVRQTLSGLGAIDPVFGAVEQTLEQAEVQVREAADAVRHALDRLDLDPERLREVEQRLEVIHDMARKHRVRPDELTAHAERLRADVEGSERAAGDMEKVETRRQAAVKSYRAAATKLTAARKRWARDLSGKVVAVIRELGMGKAEFPIAVESAPQERPRVAGDDDVRFDFTANAGQAARPLAKVASGGELSRVALAIQVVANQSRSAATLIFDEVDAGVGGGTAEIVGEKLKALAARRQVLCVTHLPQVAAQGRQHYAIQKETRAGKTLTRVKALDDKGRVEELARMLGGREITASTQAHAKEMLKRGQR